MSRIIPNDHVVMRAYIAQLEIGDDDIVAVMADWLEECGDDRYAKLRACKTAGEALEVLLRPDAFCIHFTPNGPSTLLTVTNARGNVIQTIQLANGDRFVFGPIHLGPLMVQMQLSLVNLQQMQTHAAGDDGTRDAEPHALDDDEGDEDSSDYDSWH